jgi:multicomponent Na+:H+ antiporter subunit E
VAVANSSTDWTWSSHLRSSLAAVLLLSLIWWILTEGEFDSWLVGIPAVLLGVVLSRVLRASSPNRYRLSAFIKFVPFFLIHSLRGGFDVAWRSCDPRLPIDPALIVYPLRLPSHDSSRVFFAATLNLLPGTLTAELGEDHLVVHLLTEADDILPRLAQLENLVGALFSHPILGPGWPDAARSGSV